MPILWINLIITGVFSLLVLLLTVVQLKNFCTGLTTAERAAATKRAVQASRTSSYLMGEKESELLGESVIEAMQTRDNSGRCCESIFNCYDMCCRGRTPD